MEKYKQKLTIGWSVVHFGCVHQTQRVCVEPNFSFFFFFHFKTSQQVTSVSGELMEGWSLQITCKIAKRVQTINIVIWQADILLQVNECARSVIVRFTRRQIGKHTQTARLQIHTCALAEWSSRGETTRHRQKHWLTAARQSPLKRCWKWVTYVYWFCCFSSLMLKLLNGWKQEELPEARRLNMCIFYFPNHFSWQAGALFFLGILPLLFSFFLFFSFPFKNDFPTTVALPFVFNRYNSNAESWKSHKSSERLCSFFTI